MKAFLLAAGKGSRLQPLTNTTPKCLVQIANKPLLEWWMELFQTHGITEVLINTHYLHEQVREFICIHNTQGKSPKLVEFYEEMLLGSGGTILANRDFVSNESAFFICYADNITKVNLSSLYEFHMQHNQVLTMGLAPSNTPEQAGIAELNKNGLITEFIEKPKYPKSNLANAGVYIANQSIFNYFPKKDFIDFAKDVLQNLTGKMYGFIIKEYHLDIGTYDNLHKAQNEWSNK